MGGSVAQNLLRIQKETQGLGCATRACGLGMLAVHVECHKGPIENHPRGRIATLQLQIEPGRMRMVALCNIMPHVKTKVKRDHQKQP